MYLALLLLAVVMFVGDALVESGMKTERGAELVQAGSNLFRFVRAQPDTGGVVRQYWRCRKAGCCAGLVLSEPQASGSRTILTIGAGHSIDCGDDTTALLACALRQDFVRASCAGALRGETVSQRVYQQIRSRVPAAQIPFMPTYESLRRSAQRAVNRTRPPEPSSLTDLTSIPQQFLNDLDGEPYVRFFLQFPDDDGTTTKILGFGTERDLLRLFRSRLVFGDGTFKIVPRIWNEENAGQFFSLSSLFGVPDAEHLYNRFTCLMSRKTSTAYRHLFRELYSIAETMGVTIEWVSFKVDYESAILVVLREFSIFLAPERPGWLHLSLLLYNQDFLLQFFSFDEGNQGQILIFSFSTSFPFSLLSLSLPLTLPPSWLHYSWRSSA